MAWSTSTRSARLPDDWPKRRRQVSARAGGRCQGPTDPVTGRPHPDLPRCASEGSECDHIIPGDDHRLDNLQWLCADCHQTKTSREAAEAARAWRQRAKRPTERHPGLLDAGDTTDQAHGSAAALARRAAADRRARNAPAPRGSPGSTGQGGGG